MRLRRVRKPLHYGGLIAPARNLVLKTSGTGDRMGIDTSALRHSPVSDGALGIASK